MTRDENATLLDNTTHVTNYNGSVELTTQDNRNFTTNDNITLPATTETVLNITQYSNLDTTAAGTYGSPQGNVDVSQSGVTEAITTEPTETTTYSHQAFAMVNRTISLEVPIDNTGSHSTNNADDGTDNGRRRRLDFEIALHITLTVNEADNGGYVDLKSPAQDSLVEDPKDDPEPNTDTTSAATAAVTTESPPPSPTPVTITAESMAGVRRCLTNVRHKASNALESYVSRRKSELNWSDYTQAIINKFFKHAYPLRIQITNLFFFFFSKSLVKYKLIVF